jgi:hypothetical protein
MKAISLVLLTLGCVAWTVGAACAARSVAPTQQASARSAANAVGNRSQEADHTAPTDGGTHIRKHSDDQQNRRKAPDKKLPTSNSRLSTSKRSNELANRREPSASEDSVNSQRPGSDKSARAAKNGLAQNEAVNHRPSNRAPSAVRPAVPSLSNVRHGGPNPAIVGGARSSNARNTGAIDGTHMNRKRIGN